MRKQFLLLFFLLIAVVANAKTVTGVVTSADDGEPVIGATVQVKGGTGTSTDFDGKFSIDVNDNQTLTFSYVGMTPQTIKVGKQTQINVVLKSDSKVLNEVVVTAMGQTQEKKKLNFAVQSLDSEQVSAGNSANFANSLQGKISGLQVSMNGGSPNSSTQVVIRAISSVNSAQSNEPLVVVDGVAVRGGGAMLSDFNSSDIENMTVLKGAAASALYGQEASNGVIMITTKNGRDGKITVNASGSWEISNAVRVPKIQQSYAPGSKGFYKENAVGGWGPMLSADDVIYDNVGKFLGTGFLQKYDVNISGGNEKYQAYASASYLGNNGVVQNDYKNQINVFVKGTFSPSKKVKIQLSANVIDTKARGFGDAMSTVYGWAINKNMADYKLDNGFPNWANRYDNWDALSDADKVNATTSPYYARNMDGSKTESTRIMINGMASYEPIKNLVFTARVGYDKGFSTYDAYYRPRYQDSDFIDPTADDVRKNESRYGSYTFQPSRSSQIVATVMGTYGLTIAKDYNLNFMIGGEYKENTGLSAQLAGQEFILGGDFYSFANINPETFANNNMYLTHSNSNKYGYFGEIRFDYKGMAQLSVTGRYDGSSTLKQANTSSYFYPSVTGGIIFSELFKLANNWFSYGKIRGNWAKVGKSPTSYLFTDSYKHWVTFPGGGYGIDPTVSRADKQLEPEMTSSWEIGADLRFFNSRTRLDIAYYATTVDNQIVTVRVSPASGTILQTRNEGKIENKGLELSIGQDIIKTPDILWTANLNFSYNRGKVLSLPDELNLIQGTQYGDIYPCAYLGGSTTAVTGKDYMRNEAGQVLVDENGFPIINPEKQVIIGNREPKALLGFGSNFTWKGLSVGFLLDCRFGGDVVNLTNRGLISNGQHHLYDKYRNREVVFNGVVAQPDGSYAPNTTPVVLDSNFVNNYLYAVSSNFIEDGSYLRLSYVTVGYDFTKLLSHNCPIKGLNISATGRNLFLLTKYSGSDPQIKPSGSTTGTGSMGIDYYSVPQTRSFNISLKATF